MVRIHRRTIQKKGINEQDNHNGVATQLELEFMEDAVEWALGSITTNKAIGDGEIPLRCLKP